MKYNKILLLSLLFVLTSNAFGYTWPVKNTQGDNRYDIIATLGERRSTHHHGGVDINGALGDPCYTVLKGSLSSFHSTANYTSYQELTVGNVTYRYLHIDNTDYQTYKNGKSEIEEGVNFCALGPWSAGPHLHFEVHKNGLRIDPLYNGYLSVNDNERPSVAHENNAAIIYCVNDNVAKEIKLQNAGTPSARTTSGIHNNVDICAQVGDYRFNGSTGNNADLTTIARGGTTNIGVYSVRADIYRVTRTRSSDGTYTETEGSEIATSFDRMRLETISASETIRKNEKAFFYTGTIADNSTHVYRVTEDPDAISSSGSHIDSYWNTRQAAGGAADSSANCNANAMFPDGLYRIYAESTNVQCINARSRAFANAIDNFTMTIYVI